MRALIVTPEVQKEIANLVQHAKQPENWFHPGSGFVPGDHEEFVTTIQDGYRCVFTYTFDKGELYRHLTISVNHPSLFASPQAAVVIARLFGFTGGEERDLDLSHRIAENGWMVQPNERDHCVTMVQPVDAVAHA